MTEKHLFLGKDSPLITKYHTNWRIKTIISLNEARAQDMHYSSGITISYEDALQIQSLLVKSIEASQKLVKDTEPESAFALCIDFFEL